MKVVEYLVPLGFDGRRRVRHTGSKVKSLNSWYNMRFLWKEDGTRL